MIISLEANEDWHGKLYFDTPRHQTIMQMPSDWPRINQFPEWFTVKEKEGYTLQNLTNGTMINYNEKQLSEGIEISLEKGSSYAIKVEPM